jgi:hypothetical protein
MASGLTEGVNGRVAQACNHPRHLLGHGGAVKRPQEGGGGGRREGELNGVAGSVD